jgi:hypothetical protein
MVTNLETGTTLRFQSLADVDAFLGRSRSYTRTCLKNGYRISSEDGKPYDVIVDPRQISQGQSKYFYKKPQPCCSCVNFAVGCEWSERFQPVPGWTAIPSKIERKKGCPIDSFEIIDCPEYQKG